MENLYEQHDWFSAENVEEVAEEVIAEEAIVEEVVIEEPVVEEVVEEKVVEAPKKDFSRKSKKGKVVYAVKPVKVAGIIVEKGYSKIADNLVEDVIKHPKVRLASEEEIATYWEE